MAKKHFYIRAIGGPVSALMLTMGSFGMMSDANATAIVQGLNQAPACTSCHAGSQDATTGLAGLKAFCKAKYPSGTGAFSGSVPNQNEVCIVPAPAPAPAPKPAPLVWSTIPSNPVGPATTGASATDVYAVTCGVGTAKLSVAVRDLPPAKASVVSIQAIKGFLSSPLSTDAVDGDAAFSPTATLAAGAGIYSVQVNKQLSAVIGPELYTANFACLNATGVKTPTSAAVIKQNQ